MDTKTEQDLIRELEEARRKFPSNEFLLGALIKKTGDLADCMLSLSRQPGDDEAQTELFPRDVYIEALQVACVAIRIAEEGDPNFQYRHEDLAVDGG